MVGVAVPAMELDLMLRRIILKLLLVLIAACAQASSTYAQGPRRAWSLPDTSGLACAGPGMFVVVHDAKTDGTKRATRSPRVGLYWLPDAKRNVPARWQTLPVDWPRALGPGSDLESVARLPGSSTFLMAESGGRDKQGQVFNRIFAIDLSVAPVRSRLLGVATFPVEIVNVEATTIWRMGDRFFMLFAERGEGDRGSAIQWADLALDPLRVGPVRGAVAVKLPAPVGPRTRAIAGMTLDDAGQIFVVSTRDGGDGGPFASAVWRVGRVQAAGDGIDVALDPAPSSVAVIDGFKIEGLAFCSGPDGDNVLYGAIDDELHGGGVRPLPRRDRSAP
jgi:hypothetical protein